MHEYGPVKLDLKLDIVKSIMQAIWVFLGV